MKNIKQKISTCWCGGNLGKSTINLGDIPSCDAYSTELDEALQVPTAKVEIAICDQCSLIQLTERFNPSGSNLSRASLVPSSNSKIGRDGSMLIVNVPESVRTPSKADSRLRLKSISVGRLSKTANVSLRNWPFVLFWLSAAKSRIRSTSDPLKNSMLPLRNENNEIKRRKDEVTSASTVASLESNS